MFEKGASATDQSLIAAGNSIVVENNYGYTGPAVGESGATTEPGLERVDVRGRPAAARVWRSRARSRRRWCRSSRSRPASSTPTPSRRATTATDAWYFTALDFRTGAHGLQALAGTGLGYNNNYAPVTLGPDGTAYVGVLGGLIRLADATPPGAPRHGAARLFGGQAEAAPAPPVELPARTHAGGRRCARRPVRARVRGGRPACAARGLPPERAARGA